MNQNKIDMFKKALIKEKKDILSTIDSLNEDTKDASLKEYTSELSVYDNHPADIATETYMAEQDMNLRSNEVEILNKIDHALHKIKNKTYGKCEDCGKDIEIERLEIMPYATECSNCMSHEIVTDEMNVFRPLEEDSLKYPFGRSNNDIDEYNSVGVDGEDIYQEVEKYNKIDEDYSFNGGDKQGVFDKGEAGIVEKVDKITNQYYKRTLE